MNYSRFSLILQIEVWFSIFYCITIQGIGHKVQELISVRSLVMDLAQLTCQKTFDCRNAILMPSATLLGTSYNQIVVAVLLLDAIFERTLR